MMRRTAPLLVLIAAMAALPAWAQPVEDGPEFQVNTFMVFSQFDPDVVILPNGDVVIVFTDIVRDGSGAGVYARRFDSAGSPLDPNAFLVNLYTTMAQANAAIAADGAGGFVVVWRSDDQDGDGSGVFGRVFDSSGAPVAAEFQVNEYTTGYQGGPALSMRPDGEFVVVWSSVGQDGDYAGVFGRRMTRTGVPRGGEFQVNVFTTDQQKEPSIGMDLKGDFVVTWHGYQQEGSDTGIFGRRFNSSGSPLTGEFLINEWTTSAQKGSRIAMHPTGEFVVAWRTFNADGSGYGVAARRFHGTTDPAGPEFIAHAWTTGWQRRPDVAMDAAGNFVMVWDSPDQDGDAEGAFARIFDAGGTPSGGEFQVNTYTTSSQSYGSVALAPGGGFVVAWQSDYQDGSGHGVFAQRYAAPDACGLLDADADGMGDLCDVALISPIADEILDCANPKTGRPWVAWNGGNYDRFRIQIGFEASFEAGSFVTSGSKLKRGSLWRPSTKKWKKVCRGAAPEVYVRVLGVDVDLPKTDPDRESFSQTIQTLAVN